MFHLMNIPSTCPACGGNNLEWGCHPINHGGVQDGRIRMSEVGVQFALGCVNCSETVARITGDQAAAILDDTVRPIGFRDDS